MSFLYGGAVLQSDDETPSTYMNFNCIFFYFAGCAFVTYTSKQCAINAIKNMHHSQTMEVRLLSGA